MSPTGPASGDRRRIRQIMTTMAFTSVLGPGYKQELERLLFFNQNQEKVRADLPLLIERYGMAHVVVSDDRLRVVLEASPEPETLYVLERSAGGDRLVGVMVYLRQGDTLALVVAAVAEDYAGKHTAGQQPLVRKMVDQLRDVARRVGGITSVTLFPATPRERKLHVR